MGTKAHQRIDRPRLTAWARRTASLWLLGGLCSLTPGLQPAAQAAPSISDPEVRARLTEKLEEALRKSQEVGKARLVGEDSIQVSGRPHTPKPKPKPTPPPPPPPPPPPDPITLIIERAAEKAWAKSAAQLPNPAVSTRWSYQGDGGPENWGRLRSDFASCSQGDRQSPIPLVEAIPVTGNPPLPNYQPSMFEVLDDGRNVTIKLDPRNLLRYGSVAMRMTEIQLHRPGEHWLGEQAPDMSVHLIHETDHGVALIIAVSLMQGDEGNPALQSIIDALPLEPGGTARSLGRLNAGDFLPPEGKRGYYMYDGSLSTPPCTEGVRWFVMTEPVSINRAQWLTFANLFEANARPLQPVAGRRIKRTME